MRLTVKYLLMTLLLFGVVLFFCCACNSMTQNESSVKDSYDSTVTENEVLHMLNEKKEEMTAVWAESRTQMEQIAIQMLKIADQENQLSYCKGLLQSFDQYNNRTILEGTQLNQLLDTYYKTYGETIFMVSTDSSRRIVNKDICCFSADFVYTAEGRPACDVYLIYVQDPPMEENEYFSLEMLDQHWAFYVEWLE